MSHPVAGRDHNKTEKDVKNWKLLPANISLELTPWSRVLLEKLTGRQLVKKFPAFY
jgi:hypothetical protein